MGGDDTAWGEWEGEPGGYTRGSDTEGMAEDKPLRETDEWRCEMWDKTDETSKEIHMIEVISNLAFYQARNL